MQGRIRKRGKQSWEITMDAGRDARGRRLRNFVNVRGTKADAQRRLRELLSAHDKGLPLDNSKVTVAEYLSTWLRDVVAVRNRPRTAESYATIVHRHVIPALGTIRLTKLQPGDVERLEASLLGTGLSANTVHHVHVVLAKALKDALRKGLLHHNVCQAVEAPRVGRYEVNVPDTHGISRILTLARDTPYGTLYHFPAFTGCRRGEALALRWENADLERGTVSIVETAQRVKGQGIVFQPTKSAAGRRGIALDAGTVIALRDHRGQQVLRQVELEGAYCDQGLVFPGPLGEPLDPSVVTRNFEKLARKAGYSGLRLHDLRHGHAAGLIRAGTHPRVVQERLGHASAAFTMQVYGHVAAGLQAEAASAFADVMAGQGRSSAKGA